MQATSGLSEECLRHVGQRLEVRLELGAGWRVLHNAGREAREYEQAAALAGRFLELMPVRFYRHHGVLRAFKAVALLPRHPLTGKEVLAYSLDDGFAWDFSQTICPRWGLLFGKGEPHFPARKSPERWPAIFQSGIVAGFGADLRKKTPVNVAALSAAG